MPEAIRVHTGFTRCESILYIAVAYSCSNESAQGH